MGAPPGGARAGEVGCVALGTACEARADEGWDSGGSVAVGKTLSGWEVQDAPRQPPPGLLTEARAGVSHGWSFPSQGEG